MPATHKLIIRSRTGIKRGELTGTSAGGTHGGFLSLVCNAKVNAPGVLQFTLDQGNTAIDALEIDGQIEYMRNGVLFLRGLYQGPHYETNEQNREMFTATCAGEMHYLSRAAVMWPAKTINRSQFDFVEADTLMHTLVKYNITSEATIENGRFLTTPIDWISVDEDLAFGEVIDSKENSGKGLLEELQEIANLGNLDFDLIKVGDFAWRFRMYEGQRGTDRTASVLFSRQRVNMGQIVYDRLRIDEKNVAVVGGSGLEDDREFTVRYGPDYSPAQHREMFVSSSNSSGIAQMQAEGDKELEAQRTVSKLSFVALETARTRYGVDYGLGDIVSVTYKDVVAAPFKVVSVNVSLQIGITEELVVEMEQQ